MPVLDPIGLLHLLLTQLHATDACEPWDDATTVDGVSPGLCASERAWGDRSLALSTAPPKVVDLVDEAARARYADGTVKRTAYPRVELHRRRLVIGLHQMGVEVPSTWPSFSRVSAHYVVLPDGSIVWLHPHDVRLRCTNRVDRAPWHCIGIEFAGNFEGIDGNGRWAGPPRNGQGRASDAQIASGRWLVQEIVRHVGRAGATVEGILPHRTTGRDKRGGPNRQICPGSRVWGEVGEWAGAELGLAIPGDTWALGGLPVPAEWRSEHHARCRRFFR
jgi:hypothetical protein